MKVAVFSDIHGNYQALKAIVRDIKKNNVNEIICLGDSIGLGPSSKQCLDLIFKENIKYLLGNHELYYIYSTSIDDEIAGDEINHHRWIRNSIGENYIEKLKNQKIKLSLNILDKKITFFHFFQNKGVYPFYDLNVLSNNSEVFSNEDTDYVFFGHEHSEHYYELGNKKFYCVGSSGCSKNNETFYHIITITSDVKVKYEKRIINYDRDSFENVLINAKYPEKEIISKIFFGL